MSNATGIAIPDAGLVVGVIQAIEEICRNGMKPMTEEAIFTPIPDGLVESEDNTEARALLCGAARVVDQSNATRHGVIAENVVNGCGLGNPLVVEVKREGVGQLEVATGTDTVLEGGS